MIQLASRKPHPWELEGGSGPKTPELHLVSSRSQAPAEVQPPVILLADDDRGQRLLYRHCLERAGYTVIEADDGRQCLELFVTEQPDLVLLDAVMPEMNGFDCCSEIKHLDGDQDTPVLMITGLDDQASVDQAFDVGASDYVTKPIHWAVLLKRLHRLIEGNRARQALLEQRTREQQSLEREQALIRVIQGIRQSLDLRTIFSTAVHEIGGLFNVERAMILRYHRSEGFWSVAADYRCDPTEPGALGREFYDEGNIWLEGFRALKYLYCEDIRSWQGHRDLFELAEEFPGSWLQLPLILPSSNPFPEGLWGCLVLVAPCYHIWPLTDKRSLDTLTDQLIIAIHQAQLVEDLETLNRGLEEKVRERTAQLDAQVEELQRIDALKDEFISRVSHELRTPLASFKVGATVLTQILQQETLNGREKVDLYLNILKEECEREIKLVNDLLDIQQLEAGIRPDSWQWIDLKLWLPSMVEGFLNRGEAPDYRLRLDLPEVLSEIQTLPNSLEALLRELLNNACKSRLTDQGIVVRARADHDHVILSVLNLGVEIPSDELSFLCDPGCQITGAALSQSGGSGLGLALVRARVQSLKGELTVSSGDNLTEFRITLPKTQTTQPV